MIHTDEKPIWKGFDQFTPEEEIAAYAASVRQTGHGGKSLAALLPENLPLYAGRGTNQTIRIRGYILSSFECTVLPDSALPFVLEALESSRKAYMVAAAAIAVRGMPNPSVQVVPYLLKAITNIRYVDDMVTFETYKPQWPLKNSTTALKEIMATLQWLGAYASGAVTALQGMLDGNGLPFNSAIKEEMANAIRAIMEDDREVDTSCCTLPLVNGSEGRNGKKSIGLSTMVLEDQKGQKLPFGQFFTKLPTIVVFFYTRCTNPNKCSLTVTKLGLLHNAIKEGGLEGKVKTAAITYDPGHDNPQRLKAYGENRGLLFDENNRAFRVDRERFMELQKYFELGVNYSGSIVNQHRVELFLLDKKGKIAKSFTRLQWDVEEVLEAIKVLVDNRTGYISTVKSFLKQTLTNLWSILPPIAIAFFPKCPVCWMAYLSFFGVAGINSLPYTPWLLPVFVVVMGINLFVLFRGAGQRNGFFPLYISAVGALFILVFGLALDVRPALYTGIALVFFGSLFNSLPFKTFLKISNQAKRLVAPLSTGF